MNRIFEYLITPSDVPCTVGEYLKKKGYSRQIIIHLKKTEHGILQNGGMGLCPYTSCTW